MLTQEGVGRRGKADEVGQTELGAGRGRERDTVILEMGVGNMGLRRGQNGTETLGQNSSPINHWENIKRRPRTRPLFDDQSQ